MKNLLALFAAFSFSFLFPNQMASQVYWKGGTPGAETKWDNPKNWSDQRIPDWTSERVVIPDVSSKSGFFPVIASPTEEIPNLEVQSGAKLSIALTGMIVIDGATTWNYGIFNMGSIKNKGKLCVKNTKLNPLFDTTNGIQNLGEIYIDDIPLHYSVAEK